MGLDGVEIVMQVEETFGITIENTEAEKIHTPADLIQLVLGKINCLDQAVCLTQRAFHHLRKALMRRANLKRHEIKTVTPLKDILIAHERQRLLQQIIHDLEVHEIPKFVRPVWVENLLVWSPVGAGFLTLFALSLHPIVIRNSFAAFMLESPVLSSCVVAGITAGLLVALTQSMRNEFASSIATVGEFSRWIVANNAAVLAAPKGKFTQEQVKAGIRQIVIEYLDCADIYSDSADFVKDLGLD